MIDAYLELEEKKEAEKAEWQKLAKEKGIYEVDKILNVEIHHGVREYLKTCSEKVNNFAIHLTETRVPRSLEGLGSRGRHHGAGGQPGLSRPDRKIHGQPREVADDVNENGKIARIS